MNDTQIKSYKDLRVWREAMEIAAQSYRLSARFPRDEAYGLTSQLRRAVVSIAANIAEGYGRESTGAYVQFLKVAQGSLKEAETLLLLAEQIEVAPKGAAAPLLERTDALGRMLNGLIRSLQKDSS
jgi:four helix bundle protein